MKKKLTADEIVDIVTDIRRRNNISWMALLKLALVAEPRKAKRLVQQIVDNDAKVTKWMSRL